jgi:hypothetical protein
MTPWTNADDCSPFHHRRMTCIFRGKFFIGRKRASAISAILSTFIIFDMAFLTEHRLLPILIDVIRKRICKKF